MPLLAATATATHHSTAPLLLAALVAGAVYMIACLIWPFRNCRHCHGIGRFHAPGGRAWRPCRWCHGTGAKLRAGRHLYNALKRAHDRADH
jgi:hypothetical protein